DTVTGTGRFEWVRHGEGTKTHDWVNGKTASAASYTKIKHWYSYDGEMFVPEDRTSSAITLGAAATWDDVEA
ncbi:hypothetical protein QCD71_25355, partial [Sphingomonas sp. PsM26]|nr:hypothetical protein [Sphingomonas sp. PsM26]